MKTLKDIFESLTDVAAKEGEPWVVIINAGYGRQTTWPNADKPGTFTEEEARAIALENNPSSQYAWHAKPLSQALEYVTSGNKCYYALQDLQMQYEERYDVTEDSNNYSDLEIGDPVIITGRVELKGSTGEVVDFDSTKSFVVVNLYNHGKHSFHFTDVSYNDYADSDEEEADMYDRDPDARAWAHSSDLEEDTDTKPIWGAGAEAIASYLHRRYDGRSITKKEISKEYKAAGFPWGHRFMLGPDYKTILQYYNSMPKNQMSLDLGEGAESVEDIDRQIEFHKKGQAAAQYKGPMNKKHAAKIRDLVAKKESLGKKEVSEGIGDIKRLAGLK